MSERFPRVGDTLVQRYQLREVLAQGGMGMVFRAREFPVERDVAVKMVRPDNVDRTEVVARFEREVRLAQQLQHPNIVQLYDFGRTQGGVLYFVMELLQGADLKDVIAQSGPMTVGRAAAIIAQVAAALTEAHRLGIVHRDLKPSNIFVTRVADRDVVKLLDFGLAKSLAGHDQNVTSHGRIPGTSGYMAPERFVSNRLNKTADVYAMGLITLEMLAGQRIVQGASIAQNIVLHLKHGVTVPPRLTSTAFGQLIDCATDRRGTRRPADAQAFLDDLNAALPYIAPDLRLTSAESRDAVLRVGDSDLSALAPFTADDVLRELFDGAEGSSDVTESTQISEELLLGLGAPAEIVREFENARRAGDDDATRLLDRPTEEALRAYGAIDDATTNDRAAASRERPIPPWDPDDEPSMGATSEVPDARARLRELIAASPVVVAICFAGFALGVALALYLMSTR